MKKMHHYFEERHTPKVRWSKACNACSFKGNLPPGAWKEEVGLRLYSGTFGGEIMKRLLNTLYITSSNRYLSLDGENVVVLEKETEIGRIPLHNLEAIVTFGYTGASPALMGACAARGIGLTFLSASGRFLARVTGEVYGNVTLRREQYRCSENPELGLRIAKSCITGKIYNSRWVLERAIGVIRCDWI